MSHHYEEGNELVEEVQWLQNDNRRLRAALSLRLNNLTSLWEASGRDLDWPTDDQVRLVLKAVQELAK